MAVMISEHFCLDDIIKSGCANDLGIDNYPCEAAKNQLIKLCNTIMEKIWVKAEKEIGKGIIVNSTYRSKTVNDALGNKMYNNSKPRCYNNGYTASKTSQHMKGEAIDISYSGKERQSNNKKLFDMIKQMIKDNEITIGQLINENNYQWVHVSLGTANQELKMINNKNTVIGVIR